MYFFLIRCDNYVWQLSRRWRKWNPERVSQKAVTRRVKVETKHLNVKLLGCCECFKYFTLLLTRKISLTDWCIKISSKLYTRLIWYLEHLDPRLTKIGIFFPSCAPVAFCVLILVIWSEFYLIDRLFIYFNFFF